jgi:hypothetical protein
MDAVPQSNADGIIATFEKKLVEATTIQGLKKVLEKTLSA